MIALDVPLDFVLPPALEARVPPEARGLRRDQVRLMVSDRADDRIAHTSFTDLPRFLRAGDLLVVNDSATLPAALEARTATGDGLALHLSTRLADTLWVVEPRRYAATIDERLTLAGDATAILLAPYRGSRRLWVARLDLSEPVLDYLARWGRPITYPYVEGRWPIELYQTMFAAAPGSAEMPSAGRAFTPAVVDELAARGVSIARLTLHTGVASLEHDELPYPERVRVPAATAAAVNATKAAGGRAIATGTTVVRALESAVGDDGRVRSLDGWTDLVVDPSRPVRAVDGLLTGFHEPKATHLAMLAALASVRHLELAYRAALEHGYLWHEFGDLHLIL